ncbi:MAG: 50S ribosomal protein L16, partial [archaeon]
RKQSYTRYSKKKQRKNFLGGVPQTKVRQFNMGNPIKDFDSAVDLMVNESIQLRDNAIESLRLMINRLLVKKLGKDNFFMKIRIYPHHFLRENKMASGAGADRIQSGMGNCPFGKIIGRAARLRKNQKIVTILCDKEKINVVRKVLENTNTRITCNVTTKFGPNKGIKTIGTKPSKTRAMRKEEQMKKEEESKKTETSKEEGKESKDKKEDKEGKEGKKESKDKKTEKPSEKKDSKKEGKKK